MLNNGMFTSNTDLWSTPQDFFDKLDDEFGFDVDVCATDDNTKCNIYFTKEDDGLIQDWGLYDNIWCNPPYGREIGKWVKKGYEEYKKNPKITIVMLLPARTDTRWFHDYIYHKAEIRFVKGRLKFGDSKNAAPFPSMVVVYQEHNNI